MKMLVLAFAASVGIVAVAASYNASAQEAAQATPTMASASPSGAPTATATVRPTPPPEPIPPTPGPPSPTPALPEEGGPPGGVLGGHVYVDEDGSRSFTTGDRAAGGGVGVNPIVDGSLRGGYGGSVDAAGRWEVRALPDGVYRVSWDASGLPEDQWPLTTPPVETINTNPADTIHDNTIHVITRVVEIKGANRILDIDFGIPPQRPAVGANAAPQLPSTGSGGGGTASLALLYVAIGASAALGLGGVALRRRANRRG